MLDAVHAAIEGPGSVPIKFGALSGRGMLDVGTQPGKLGTVATIEGEDVKLHIASDRLPDCETGARLFIGAADLAAANVATENDTLWRVVSRKPIDDGLIHELVLEGGS